MTSPAVISETIFVDTNAFSYIRSYLSAAQSLGLPPFGPELSQEDLNSSLRGAMPKGQAQYLLKGAKALSFLKKKADNDASIYVSIMSVFEAINSAVESQLNAQLAAIGLGPRGRQRINDRSDLVKHFLTPETHEQITSVATSTISIIQDNVGFEIKVFERSERDQVAVLPSILEPLISHTRLDVQDAWIASAAIISFADAMVSYDGDFREVINRINNPSSDAEWIQVRDVVIQALRGVHVSVHPGIPIGVPSAVSPDNYEGLV